MKKAIVIIQSENGAHKSSIIRSLSQILLGMSATTIVNQGEIGLTEDIVSVVKIDNIQIAVSSENFETECTASMIFDLIAKGNQIVLFATQNSVNIEELKKLLIDPASYTITHIQSTWSDKLEVDYLDANQMGRIVNEINRVRAGSD